MNDKSYFYNKESLKLALQIWEKTSITITDVRHNILCTKEEVKRYESPACALLYICTGSAKIGLNKITYQVDRFGLFLFGKGTYLSMIPVSECVEYYMLLYKAKEPYWRRRDYMKMIEQYNPFIQTFQVVPIKPVFFSEQLKKIYERFVENEPLSRFYIKACFYQLIYEVYEELYQSDIQMIGPDLTAMLKQHMDDCYKEPISIQTIAATLGISNSHLRRSFKKQYGQSPQEYLTHTRIAYAKSLLKEQELSIKQVAISCGFPDEFNFSRAFQKKEGIPPKDYRAKTSKDLSDSIMDYESFFSYNDKSLVSYDELKKGGYDKMMKHTKNKALMAATMSVMLLLSACQTNTTTSVEETKTDTVQSVADAKENGNETKTVTTVRGQVEIPSHPKKVVVLNNGFGDVLALGVVPAAVNDYWALSGSPIEELLKDVERVNEPEEIMAIEPDLIITSFEKNEDYEKLSKIAPTVSLGSAADSMNQSPEERLELLGNILDVDSVTIDQALKEYEDTIELGKEKLKEMY
jgi:iron complex transport system substrate-binding protein